MAGTSKRGGAVIASHDVIMDEDEKKIPQDEDEEDEMGYTGKNAGITNMEDHFLEIMDNEQVEDVIDLNERFLSMALGGIEVNELAMLPKLELRVDTTFHNL